MPKPTILQILTNQINFLSSKYEKELVQAANENDVKKIKEIEISLGAINEFLHLVNDEIDAHYSVSS